MITIFSRNRPPVKLLLKFGALLFPTASRSIPRTTIIYNENRMLQFDLKQIDSFSPPPPWLIGVSWAWINGKPMYLHNRNLCLSNCKLVIDKVQEEKSRTSRKPPGVGWGRGKEVKVNWYMSVSSMMKRGNLYPSNSRTMTIHFNSEVQVEEKKNVEETKEFGLDGGFALTKSVSSDGFLIPEINAFGKTFRDYNVESERKKTVEEFYRTQHINQTYDFVKRMRKEYSKLNRMEMSIWECCELLNDVVDDSDPDLDEPQIQHLLQSAEAIRKNYPNEDWLHLTALIHDLGKVLTLPQFGGLPQWAVVGDTFPVGCAFDESNIHYKYFKENPDFHNPAYNTKNGVYKEGCGLDNVLISWGHDDYMYLVAKENGTTLPSAGLFIVRFHSFYALHKEGAYMHLLNDQDKENLRWLHVFNKYDLYSKSKVLVDVEAVKPYYQSLIEKYFPAKLKW